MGRPPCCDKVGIKKGPWTPEEDIILVSYVHEHGPGNWRAVPTNTGLMRCSKSCRLRWTNYLRPGIKRGNFTPNEEGMIIHLQALLGNKWAAIASYLPQRTDNDIKNYWNTHLKKKLEKFQYSAMQDSQQQLSSHISANSNYNNIHQIVSKSYNHERGIFQYSKDVHSSSSSSYASSEENISKLLQEWMMRSSSSSYPDGDHLNNKFYGEIFEKISGDEHHEHLRSSANGMLPSTGVDDHVLEGINLPFDRNLINCDKSSCGSGSVGSGVADQEKVVHFAHDQHKDNNVNPPALSVIEKYWLLQDESVISQVELPPTF